MVPACRSGRAVCALEASASERGMPESPKLPVGRLRLGETSGLVLRGVEFVDDLIASPSQEDLADELASFANSRGGEIIFGANAGNRGIDGMRLDRLDALGRFVAETALASIKPPIDPAIMRTELLDNCSRSRFLLSVRVAKSGTVHKSPAGYLRRIAGVTDEIELYELAGLIAQRKGRLRPQFDASPVFGTSIEQSDPALVDRFRSPGEPTDRDLFARTAGLAVPEDAAPPRLTVAGVLLATTKPDRWLRNAAVEAVAYRGTSAPETWNERGITQMDAMDITGPLDAQVAQACCFVARNQDTVANETAIGRKRPSYDPVAVFEALVNAVAHRDYSLLDAAIRLRMFSDRLELHVPGALLDFMTARSLPDRQVDRNGIIAGLLAKCELPVDSVCPQPHRTTFMGQRGEGAQLILDRSERHSGRRPLYEVFGESELRLTIFAAGSDSHSA